MTERSAAVEAARERVLGVISRLAQWPDYEHAHEIEEAATELGLIIAGIDVTLDDFEAACRAEGAAEMLREMPCERAFDGDRWTCVDFRMAGFRPRMQPCRACTARAEKASAG